MAAFAAERGQQFALVAFKHLPNDVGGGSDLGRRG